MKIVIVGGGKLGYYIAANLLERDYEVKLIEKDKQKCANLANSLGVEVICGDGTELEVLAQAGSGKADYLIAVTGKDQDNLVASQLAKQRFQIKKVITRANNPKNLEALRKLGMENAVSSTEIITRLIEQEIESAGMRLLTSLNKGKAVICEFKIPEDSTLEGKQLRDINLPDSSLIISILREEELIIPKGETAIYEGDLVVAVCGNRSQRNLANIFTPTKKEK